MFNGSFRLTSRFFVKSGSAVMTAFYLAVQVRVKASVGWTALSSACVSLSTEHPLTLTTLGWSCYATDAEEQRVVTMTANCLALWCGSVETQGLEGRTGAI